MNGAETIQEIEDLLKEESITPEAALRLILANQVTITKELHRVNSNMDVFKNGVEEEVDKLCERVASLERYRTENPSVTWLWRRRKRYVILAVFLIMFGYALLFGWWIGLPEIQKIIAHALGLPVP